MYRAVHVIVGAFVCALVATILTFPLHNPTAADAIVLAALIVGGVAGARVELRRPS